MVKIDILPGNIVHFIDLDDWSVSDVLENDYGAIEVAGRLEVKFESEDDLKNCVFKITNILRKRKIPIVDSSEVGDVMAEVMAEQSRFEIFTDKARSIRNNQCDKADFKEFVKVLDTNMRRRLYDLQLLSAYHLAFAQNACNFSVPGSGKTSIVYGAFCYLRNSKDPDKRVTKMVIIGPLSSFSPWESEYESCFGSKPTSVRIDGSMSQANRIRYMYRRNHADLTLISYSTLPYFEDEDIAAFFEKEDVMVVLDEAHRIKNPDEEAVHAKAVLRLSRHCKARVILTGTPVPNGYEDLYNYFRFLWPNHNIIGYEVPTLRKMTVTENRSMVNDLTDRIKPFFIRIKKSDLNLPAIKIHNVAVSMGPIQREIYQFIEEQAMSEFNRNSQITFRQAIASARIIRLMQSASNPNLLKKKISETLSERYLDPISEGNLFSDEYMVDLINRYDSIETPSKFIEALSIITSILKDGGKVIVWAYFIDTIERFSAYLDFKGITNRKLYGSTPTANQDDNVEYNATREGIIKEFNSSDSSFRVIIANPQAVGESISLHRQCHNAIYLERNFNAALLMQSMDRIHRYGLSPDIQTHYYYLISTDSVDETIDTRLELKIERMNDIIESEEIPLFKNVSEEGDEDIKALIDDYARRSERY